MSDSFVCSKKASLLAVVLSVLGAGLSNHTSLLCDAFFLTSTHRGSLGKHAPHPLSLQSMDFVTSFRETSESFLGPLLNENDLIPDSWKAHPDIVATTGLVGFAFGLFNSLFVPPRRLVDDKTLRAIIEGTYILSRTQTLPTCVYKASRDGWSAIAFHEQVDNQGSGVVLLKTALGGTVVGGFNPNGWRSTDDYTTSTAAFLVVPQRNGSVRKYPVQASAPSIFDYATSGPCFGPSDLVIGPPQGAILGGFAGPNAEDDRIQAGNLRVANIVPGQSYDTDKLWPVRGLKVPLQEVEVYCWTE